VGGVARRAADRHAAQRCAHLIARAPGALGSPVTWDAAWCPRCRSPPPIFPPNTQYNHAHAQITSAPPTQRASWWAHSCQPPCIQTQPPRSVLR
jgi:hypothetical protein